MDCSIATFYFCWLNSRSFLLEASYSISFIIIDQALLTGRRLFVSIFRPLEHIAAHSSQLVHGIEELLQGSMCGYTRQTIWWHGALITYKACWRVRFFRPTDRLHGRTNIFAPMYFVNALTNFSHSKTYECLRDEIGPSFVKKNWWPFGMGVVTTENLLFLELLK